jgi:hypothetical protein
MAGFRVGLTCSVVLIMAVSSWAQSPPLSNGALAQEKLVLPAGIIFAGQVLRIEPMKSADGTPASIRIQFRVEQAVRGCNAGETIEIAEWAELWGRGDRYRVGQHVLLFLYPRNEAGLTSPVAGDLGSFVAGASGLWRVTPQQAAVLTATPLGDGIGEAPVVRPGRSTRSASSRSGEADR